MKIGKLTNTNSKGQLVIPQEYREMFGITSDMTLNITPKHNGLFIEPVASVIPKVAADDVYADVLLATKGAWGKVDVKDKKQEKLELEASKRRRHGW